MRKLISSLLLLIPLVSVADTWNVVNFGGVSSLFAQEYGNCDKMTTLNGTCTWGDGQVMRYAGMIDNRRLFAANADEANGATFEWGAYNAGSYLNIAGITNYSDLTTAIASDLNGRTNQLAYMNACGNSNTCNTSGGGNGAFEQCGLKGMYLPSAGELNLIWQNIGTAGGMSSGPLYWSSSEYSYSNALTLFDVSSGIPRSKDFTNRVRCARSFIP
jgi:hypothetical protein